ncbi:hypothetical protein PSAR109036_13345 [Psychrobacter arenosus]|uniref:hypothetical protein n=1 Tax=Psychrobacter arenosus TaxID=256326 RepID=UPI00191A1EDA|nr:hypothetical protein [Psychrobacter arenosus]
MKKTLMVVGIALLGQTTMANAATSSIKMPKDDLVHVLGWMEDACVGEKGPYKAIDEKHTAFINSFSGLNTEGYSSKVAPRSKWMSEYRNAIKDIKVETKGLEEESGEFAFYHVMFNKGVKYRGQPLTEYTFAHRVESSGSKHFLKFAPGAKVKTILPNFKTRKVMYWDEMEDMGASYDAKTNTIKCELY